MTAAPDLAQAVAHLKRGYLLLLPTDVGWQLAADPNHAAAVARLLACRPPAADPPTVLIGEVGLLQQYLATVPEVAWDLVEFAEKPFTVLYQRAKNVADALLDDDQRLAIRLVRTGAVAPLLHRWGRGLATVPVAGVGAKAPATLAEVSEAARTAADFTFPEAPVLPRLPTLMRLDVNGSFSFVRK